MGWIWLRLSPDCSYTEADQEIWTSGVNELRCLASGKPQHLGACGSAYTARCLSWKQHLAIDASGYLTSNAAAQAGHERGTEPERFLCWCNRSS